MDKIIDFKGLKKYFCIQCKGFHIKKPNIFNQHKQFTKEIISKEIKKYFCTLCNRIHNKYISKFEKHKEFAFELTDSELWKYQFKKSWTQKKADYYKTIIKK